MALIKYPVTIVTSYFEIPSKHSSSLYDIWMRNMLQNIETPMIIFCDAKSISKINQYRSEFNKSTHIIQIEINELMCYKYLEQWRKTHKLDCHKNIHSPELYMIWAEKSEFLKKSIELNPFNSEFFLWSDIGYFRNTNLHLQPNMIKIFPSLQKISELPRDKIILLHVIFINSENNRIGGGMFGGFKDALLKWHKAYYEILEDFFAKHLFAGQDQLIMKEITVRYPELCNCLVTKYNDDWFYLHRYLNSV